ncbi:MAG: hypothetical protein HC858_03885 [Brachymonas sp.]|nr:hypothetical protein [Brachymonas sp.]
MLMARMGKQRQVIAITHLPQIASKAHEHLLVTKAMDDKGTHTYLRFLDEEERVIVDRVTGPAVSVREVISTQQLAELQKQCRQVYVDPSLVDYAVKLVTCTRTPEKHGLKELRQQITFGASPRATINLTEGARALAMLRGRSYALPEDMSDLVPEVLRHRLVLSYDALSSGLTADAIIGQIMRAISVPPKPLEHIKAKALDDSADEKLAA